MKKVIKLLLLAAVSFLVILSGFMFVESKD